MSPKPIPLFDRNRDHPSVPTWRPPERGAQARSRMPLAAPAQPARSVLDGAEHRAILLSQGTPPPSPIACGVTAPQNRKKRLFIGGESHPDPPPSWGRENAYDG